MARPTKLTEEVENVIVDHIRKGAFDYIAAEAAGVSRQTFSTWMKKGRSGRSTPALNEFFDRVCKARAEARVIAENAVFANAPFNWLRYGPGRERPGEPGWTDSKQVDVKVGGELRVVRVKGFDNV